MVGRKAARLDYSKHQRGDTMHDIQVEKFRTLLQSKKTELEQRLTRIIENHRRPLEADSEERASQLENQEVVDALGNEARLEIRQIDAGLARIKAGDYGVCEGCGARVSEARLRAQPHAMKCVECAALDEDVKRRQASR